MGIDRDERIFVAGHSGFVGRGIVRMLRARAFENLVLRTRRELDLTDRDAVLSMFESQHPAVVILAAGKVGGIAANMATPVDFLLDNLRIQNNVLEACLRAKVRKTVFLGSSCIYPREAPQPMSEDSYMHGPVEPTNESYAIAKIAGYQLSRAMREQYGLDVICPMPSNIYGPGDHFEFERSHVLSALVRRFSEAVDHGLPEVTLWGTGSARREFLHVDDLADAVIFLTEHWSSPALINVGSGSDVTIRELADLIAAAVGYRGAIRWDTSRPDGMPRKLLDVRKVRQLGWRHHIDLPEGILTVVADYRARFDPAGGGAGVGTARR